MFVCLSCSLLINAYTSGFVERKTDRQIYTNIFKKEKSFIHIERGAERGERKIQKYGSTLQ